MSCQDGEDRRLARAGDRITISEGDDGDDEPLLFPTLPQFLDSDLPRPADSSISTFVVDMQFFSKTSYLSENI